MNTPAYRNLKFSRLATLTGLCVASALFFCASPLRLPAQDTRPDQQKKGLTPKPAGTNTPSPAAKPDAAAKQTGPPESQAQPAVEKTPSPQAGDAQSKAEQETGSPSEGIQLSFQGANIEMVVQWLAQTTGKSVVKHPRVQCQLTIVSSKKISRREAITLVYHALGLEGFNAIESSKSILIVPEGQEPKLSPELVDGSRTDIPEGRQRLVKIFPLKHIQAEELKGKVRAVLSDKATIETDDRANQIIVTDYTDNLMLLGELIKELDVTSADSVIEIFSLKYAEAEDLVNLLNLVLSAQAPSQSAGSGSQGRSPPSTGGSPPPPGPGPSLPGGGPSPPGAASPPPPAGGGSQAPGQQVRLWPDKTSNRIIVAAPKSKLPEIQKLIDILDTEKPRDVTIRVIPLRNVNAEDVAKELAPLYQKMSGKSLKDIIEVTADNRSSSLIVLSSEANFQAIKKLMGTLDTEEAQERIVKTFALKNAEAEDVARQLQDLYKDQDSSSRYPFYIFPSSQGNRNPKKMSVVADRRRNTLIVQAPPASMEGIGKMIRELDEPVTDDSLAPRIYPLKYVSAVDIEDVLNELFLKKQQVRSYWDWYEGPQETADRDVGRLYGKVRITSEPYSNSIIVASNSRENLLAVEEVLKQLDVPSQAGESTLRVGLRFAKAATVANSINILFAKGGSPPLRPVAQPGQPYVAAPQQQQQQQSVSSQSSFELEHEAKEEGYYPWLGGQPENTRTSDGRNVVRPVSDLVGRVRVVPDQRSNSLLISANVHFFPQVLKLIEDLDAPTAQVLIEARIVEVSSDFLDKLGVRWSPDGSKVFTAEDYDNSILAHASGEYRKGFGGNTSVNTGSSSLTEVMASLRSGVLNSTINMDYLVQFLRKTTDATVLAEPQINIEDNETGKLFVGQQVPFIDKSQSTDVGALNQSFQYKDVGVILEVTPHINTSGDVALKIHAESSAIVPGQTLFGGAILDTRNFRTDLTAKSGDTLVLGGIIQKQVSNTLRKTPILGSIPVVGWAFKKKDKTTHEVELLVFLRPKVVRTPAEAKELMEEMDKKAPLIKKWKEEIEPNKGTENDKERPNPDK